MASFFSFLTESAWILCFLCLFALVGTPFIAPFRHKLGYPLLAAPLSGLLVVALGIAGLYGFVGFSFSLAASLTVSLGALLGVVTLLFLRPVLPKINPFFLLFIVVWILGMVFLINSTSVMLGHRGFLFMDGSDQLGYAQLSDWIRAHLTTQAPTLSAKAPYQSWPQAMFSGDARFGSFYLLAVIAWIQQQSGMFAYDSASAVALIAGILALAGIFARDKKTVFLIIIGLTLSQWYALNRSGYFGKVLCYPSVFFLLGLTFAVVKETEKSLFALPALMLLMIASAVIYPGQGLALIFMATGLLYCLFSTIFSLIGNFSTVKLRTLAYHYVVFLLLGTISVATAGSLSRPASPINPEILHQAVFWPVLWQQLFEIRAIPSHSPFYPHWDAWIFGLSLLILLFTATLAIIKRYAVVASLLLGMPLLCVLLWYFKMNWIAFQSIGLPYPAMLLGMVMLHNQLRGEKAYCCSVFVILALILSLVIRVPKFLDLVSRYAGKHQISTLQFSSQEMRTLATKIGKAPVTVSINKPMYAIPILVELGRQPIDLRWTPETWRVILGYRDWPSPSLSHTPLQLLLSSQSIHSNCRLVYQTRQYQLVHCP